MGSMNAPEENALGYKAAPTGDEGGAAGKRIVNVL